MDPVVMNIVGQDSPRKVEESKATSLEGKDSSRTAFLPCIISHEFFSPEVRFIYIILCYMYGTQKIFGLSLVSSGLESIRCRASWDSSACVCA